MKLEKITKKYKKREKEIIVLENINYEFNEGKFYLIKGHSGSGKTTLIQILGTMLNPTSGNLYIESKKINNLKNDEKAKIRNKDIGFIFQNYCLNEKLTALDNVILPMIINKKIKKQERINRAKKILEMVGLGNRIEHYPNELSGGEQQRVSIARSLANNPKIILADEPTGNLDKKNEIHILELLKKISEQGKTIIMVSHSDFAITYADKLLEIDKGKLVEVNHEIK